MGQRKRKEQEPASVSEESLPSASAEAKESSGMSPPTPDTDHECVPNSFVEEEERLRHDRENHTKNLLQDALTGSALDDKKFQKLETLLNHTNMYTDFLQQQMSDIEKVTDEDVQTALQEGKAAKKQKTSRGRQKAKEQKPDTPTQALVPLIQGELRDYQLKGVKWMVSLWSNGINGILGDQMGLGKTVQTIGFLSHLWSKHVTGPFLIVAPLSTLPNWVAEFQRWCPAIPVVLYHGSKEERAKLRKKLPRGSAAPGVKYPVYITSYEIVMADIRFLAHTTWKFLVVDEGHRLKNFNCRLLRELRTLPVLNKLLLSDVFNNLADFEGWFDFSAVGEEGGDKHIILQEQRNNVVSKLHKILRPFLLRRIKSDVEASVPPKAEIVLWAQMTAKQKELNEQLRDRKLVESMNKLSKEAGKVHGAPVSKLNNILMQMRKNCNHPDLITGSFDGSIIFPPAEELVQDCGKLQLLDRLLKRLTDAGHKVLIFSQMTMVLDLLDSYLHDHGHDACRIDGNMPYKERQAAIEDFNADPNRKVFLLSTRAGGLGINLTAADTVIIYDSDWNPHQDAQAMDRCHRIGQQKPVLVFRLATAHSVEGRMLRRAASKLKLERLVIKKGAFLSMEDNKDEKTTSMTAQELMELLKEDTSGRDKPQSGIVTDKVLDQLLDRKHLLSGKPAPYQSSGVGYEVVQVVESSGLLARVE